MTDLEYFHDCVKRNNEIQFTNGRKIPFKKGLTLLYVNPQLSAEHTLNCWWDDDCKDEQEIMDKKFKIKSEALDYLVEKFKGRFKVTSCCDDGLVDLISETGGEVCDVVQTELKRLKR